MTRAGRSLPFALVVCSLLLASTPALAIPSITRDDIIDLAKSGVGSPYVWGGTCWNPQDRNWKGPDCSGYVTKCWQIPSASKVTDCVPHYYTTSGFKSQSTHWKTISRSDLIRGDALNYNSGSAGHIVLYESGDKWGSATVYEARGSAYGVVHRVKSVESKYAAKRRDGLATAPPKVPQVTIAAAVVSIGGQGRDLCTLAGSAGLFDWYVGQKTTVRVLVHNTGDGPATGVRVSLEAVAAYLRVTHWNIMADTGGSFVLDTQDGLQSLPHDNPGASFNLDLGTLTAGQRKRVDLTVEALAYSGPSAGAATLRSWVSAITGCYAKSSFDGAPTQNDGQTQGGGQLRAAARTDVLSGETCDGHDNDCDGQRDEDNVCGGGPTPDSGGGPSADSGQPPQLDSGATQAPDSGMPQRLDSGSQNSLTPDATLRGSCAVGSSGGPWGWFPLAFLALALLLRRRR
jgi:MYXO-CTERM domain-containing protein